MAKTIDRENISTSASASSSVVAIPLRSTSALGKPDLDEAAWASGRCTKQVGIPVAPIARGRPDRFPRRGLAVDQMPPLISQPAVRGVIRR